MSLMLPVAPLPPRFLVLPPLFWEVDRLRVGSRGEKMALRGTDPESYITEYTSVYED